MVAVLSGQQVLAGQPDLDGLDDSGLAAALDPALSPVRQPFEPISTEKVRLLLEMIAGERPAATTLPTTLVRRASTRPRDNSGVP